MGNRVFDKLSEPEKLHQSPILVFAGDALVAGGLRGLGRVRDNGQFRARRHPEFLQLCRDIIADGFIDGCLLTPADAETLAVDEGLFQNTPVTPMVRLNAETWIWSPRHGNYNQQISQPFQTVPLNAAPEAAYCELRGGDLECHVKIGLYSITLNNDTGADARTLIGVFRFRAQCGAASAV